MMFRLTSRIATRAGIFFSTSAPHHQKVIIPRVGRKVSSVKKGDIMRIVTDRTHDDYESVKKPGESNEKNEEKEENERIFERDFVEHHVDDFESNHNNDPVIKEKIEAILKEYEYLKYNSMGRVPSKLRPPEMQYLLAEGDTLVQRERIFHFQFCKEMEKLKLYHRKLEEVKLKRQIKKAREKVFNSLYGDQRTGLVDQNNDLIYGLWHNSLFTRIPDKIIRGNPQSRLRQAAMFGTKVVLDFSYGDYMIPWIYRNVIEQIQDAYGLNKYDYAEPLDLWFCNLKKGSVGEEFLLNRALPNLHTTSMVTVKEDCFTNHFDHSRLVYLSPHAPIPLRDFGTGDEVYIIGAYNDKGNAKPISLRKAEALNIKCRRLPLDSYISWQSGSKSLCINHLIALLLEYQSNGRDWRASFLKHIPQRKIKNIELVIEEENKRKMRLQRIKKRFRIRDDFYD